MKYLIEISQRKYANNYHGIFNHIPNRDDNRECQLEYLPDDFTFSIGRSSSDSIPKTVKHNRDVWNHIFHMAYEKLGFGREDRFNVFIICSALSSTELAIILEARQSWLEHIDEYTHTEEELHSVAKLTRLWVPLRKKRATPHTYTRDNGVTVTDYYRFLRWSCL